MRQYTTPNHLTRTIQRLEHILAQEDYPAVRAAELLVITLLELAPQLLETEQQMKEIVSLYEQCAARQYVLILPGYTWKQHGMRRLISNK
jgi:hypothetical protein